MAERFASIANRLGRAAFRSGSSGIEPTVGFRIVFGMIGLAVGGLVVYLIWHFDIPVDPVSVH
jgi:hypothetical protein